MIVFEYLTVPYATVSVADGYDVEVFIGSATESIQELGKQGWEFVAIVHPAQEETDMPLALFKRPKS